MNSPFNPLKALTRFFASIALLSISTLTYGQFVVDDIGNAGDGNPGDGICDTSGPGTICTLRAAMEEADASAGPNTITFDITLLGQVITIDSELEINTDTNTSINGDIDGDLIPDVTVRGGNVGLSTAILVQTSNNQILYLHIVDIPNGAGIMIDGATASANVIAGCYIGTDLTGGVLGLRNQFGVRLTNSASGNFVGNPAENYNVLTGNNQGIYIDNLANNNQIYYNVIGLDASRTLPLGNLNEGVLIDLTAGTDNLIGSNVAGEGNLISGNSGNGLTISGGTGTQLLGNFIGTDGGGSLGLGNTNHGVSIVSGAASIQIGDGSPDGANIISRNTNSGVQINGSGSNVIQGNIIGLAPDGITVLGNGGPGVSIINGATDNLVGGDEGLGLGNTISDNAQGILIQASDNNMIYGNYIGLTDAGGQGRGNSNAGIEISGVSASSNEIGDATIGFGNVISDNNIGILFQVGNDNIIEGNIIGMNAAGNVPRGNTNSGIQLAGGTGTLIGNGTANGANYISANGADGITIDGVIGTIVDNNFIGTELDGVSPIGNSQNGISVLNGATSTVLANSTIANNIGNGVDINEFVNDTQITLNSIHTNSNEGIDILSGLPNPPSITSLNASNFDISGTADAGATVEIFVDMLDEGQVFIGSLVTGGPTWTYDADGSDFPGGFNNITATQLSGGYTSEFSSTFDITSVFSPFVVVNTNDDGLGSLRWCLENANTTPGADVISFNIPISDPGYDVVDERWTITPLTNLPQITEAVTIDATTQPQPSTSIYRIILDGDPNSLNYGFEANATSEFYGFFFTGFRVNTNSAGISLITSAGGSTIGGIGAGNLFNNNQSGIGVLLADNNIIKGNLFGTNDVGTAAVPNNTGIRFASGSSGNIIGGPLSGEENLISGNTARGLLFNAGGGNTLENNLIGTDITGLLAIANGEGVNFGTSSGNTIRGNVISGNTGSGIQLVNSNSNFFYDNKIGVGIDGTTPLGNIIGIEGFGVASTNVDDNTIGGTGAGEPNIIAHNSSYGISIPLLDMDNNSFIANSIFGNTDKGINLGTVGNDGKTPPAITTISAGAVSGTGVDGETIHAYRDNTGNPGPLQGAEYIGSTTVAGGVWTVADGSIVDTDLMNATATGGAGSTSEFAINFAEILVFQGTLPGGTQIFDGQAASVDFGVSTQGTDLDQVFTIQNKSSSVLTITSITVAGSDFSIVLPTPTSVGPNSSATFTARLSGASIGIFGDVLTINSDDADEASFNFNITGEIVDPFIVTNTNDSGIGSLRWAIDNANTIAGTNTISFNIPTSDPNYDLSGNQRWTIQPATELPQTTEGIIIDATTQPGAATFRILVDGQGTLTNGFDVGVGASPASFYGLYITDFQNDGIIANNVGSAGVFVGDVGMGNVINNCDRGIALLTSSNHVIKGNFIGTDPSGMSPMANTRGIVTTTATNVIIGGSLAGEENVISGNTQDGINHNVGNNHLYQGNFIGTNVLGTAAIPNGGDGIQFGSSNGHQVLDNIISGNGGNGILLVNTDNTTIRGNNIGVGLNGTDIIPNDVGIFGSTSLGVSGHIIGGIGVGEANIIARNTNQGVEFGSALHLNNSIIGNSMFCNGDRGIDLDGVGNGGKTSPQILQIVAGLVSGSGTNGDVIHVYRDNGSCAPLQGDEYLGTTTVAGGLWSFADGSILAADLLNATATDASGNTSEFAINYGEIMVFLGDELTGTIIESGQPLVVDLGVSVQGSDLDQVFTIQNKSNSLLTISSINLGVGTTYSIVGVPPATVAANSTESFTVRISGAGLGTFVDDITINSDDENEGTFLFNMTGEIVDPYIVTNVNNSGIGSLRWAIGNANSNAGANTITFDGSILDQTIIIDGPITITDDATTIDGDILGDCLPHIAISGAGILLPCTGNACVGLIINSNDNTLKHINIQGFLQAAWGEGVQLNGNNNFVIGCYIGTNLAGTDATGTNNYVGIRGNIASSGNTIGGLLACESNVISGNDYGMALNGPSNMILGNFIGTDPTGTSITNLGNQWGINLSQSSAGNTVGSLNPLGRNIISGNSAIGLRISGAAAQNNTVIGNYIGTDVNGTSPLANGIGIGVFFDADNNQFGDGSVSGRNIISGNTTDGMQFQASSATIIGNYIGVDASGINGLGNGQAGIRLSTGGFHNIGGISPGEGNVISGNGLEGMSLTDDNIILGNYIGTDANGANSIPNTEGIQIGGQRNQIGDGTAAGLNVISGNAANGILDWGIDNDILFNYIGVESDGSTAQGNGSSGIEINFGGDDIVSNNVISNNSIYGINIRNTTATDNNLLSQNSIYANVSGGINIQSPSQMGILPPTLDPVTLTTITGTSNNSATIELYADAVDQGEFYIGSTTADGSGNWNLLINPFLIPAGLDNLTALQTVSSNTSAFSVAVPSVVPPSNLFADEISTTQIDLTWDDNSANETGFTIERSDGDNTNFVVLNTVGVDVTTYTDNTVTADNGYFYRVIANSGSGDSGPSNEKFAGTYIPPGHALDFDGVDDEVSVTHNTAFNPTNGGQWTVEAWINPANVTTQKTIVFKGNSLGINFGRDNWIFQIRGEDNNQLDFVTGDPNANGIQVQSTAFVTNDEWQHVAISISNYGQSAASYTFYINGIDAGRVIFTDLPMVQLTNTDPMQIGMTQTLLPYEGGIDDLRIWDVARTQLELQNNMFTELAGNEPNLVAYYRFDQGIPGGDNTSPPINILPDRSTNNHNGTLINFGLNGLTTNWVDSEAMGFELVGTNPQSLSIDNPISSNLTFTFSSAVDGATVGSSNFLITGEQTGIIPGTFTGGGTATITFDPDNDFKPGETIRVTLLPAIQNTSAIGFEEPVHFQFTTEVQVGPETPAYFEERIVDPAFSFAFSTMAGDIDGDDDIDILAAAAGDNKISWFENDGSQGFTERIVTTLANGADEVYMEDVDQDGDMDLLSASQVDEVAWYENDGSQNFTKRVISASAGTTITVRTGDIDGDGDIDVISGSFDINIANTKISWYENDGSEGFTENLISGLNPTSLELVDMDSDGDMDILVSSEAVFVGPEVDRLAWYENDGSQVFTERVISETDRRYSDAMPVDMDGDGDLDVVATGLLNFLGWYENDGNQSFTENEIGSAVSQPRHTHVTDIDGDGDNDVLVIKELQDEIAWWENDGAQNFVAEYTVSNNVDLVNGIYVADVDSDGDIDVLSASRFDNKISWHENTVIPPNIPPHIYWTDDIGAASGDDEIHKIDLDGTNFLQYYSGFADEISGIAIDETNNKIYWTDAAEAEIWVADIGSIGFSSPRTNLIDYNPGSSNDLRDIDLDVAGNKMYWTHGNAEFGFTNKIGRANLDGSLDEELIDTGSEEPFGVGLDLVNNKVYYTTNEPSTGNDARLYRSNLDGSGVELLYHLSTGGPTLFFRDVIVDNANDIVYWSVGEIGASPGYIYYNDINEPPTFAAPTSFSFSGEPRGLDLDLINNKIYWVCKGDRGVTTNAAIMRADLDGSTQEIVFNVVLYPAGYPAVSSGSEFLALDLRGVTAPSPTVQASNIVFSGHTSSQVDITWTAGDGANRVVLMKAISPVDSDPVDGSTYTASSTFGAGDQIGTGNFVLYNGSGNSVTIDGLVPGISYEVRVYEYNGTLGSEVYLTSTAVNNPSSVLLGPEIEIYVGTDNTGILITDGDLTPINFGSTLVGSFLDQNFYIENIGNMDLSLTSITTDGSEFNEFGGFPTTISPGSGSIITIRYNASVASTPLETVTIVNDDFDEAPYDFVVSATATLTAEPEIELYEGIDNSGTPIISGQLTAINFGSGVAGTDIDFTFAIENIGTSDLNISGIAFTGSVFSIPGVIPGVVGAGSTETFVVRLNATTAGNYTEQINISSDDTDEPNFIFDLTGVITSVAEPEIEIFVGPDNSGSPVINNQLTPVDFGNIKFGNDLDQTFTIENTGSADLNVTLFQNTGDPEFLFLGGPAAPIAPGTTENFTYRLSGAVPGTFNGSVEITSDDTDESLFTFPITGQITEPEIELYFGPDNTGTTILNGEPTATDIGSAEVGTNIAVDFAIENTGLSDLIISSVTVSEPEYSVLNSFPISIPSGLFSVFTVELDGTDPGTFIGNITIISDDLDEGSYDFPISGIITTPEIEVYIGADNTGTPLVSGQTNAYNFGSILTNTFIDQSFAVFNSGSSILQISDVTTTAPEFTLVAPSITNLDPGMTGVYVVRFESATAGSFTGSLEIQTNDLDEAVFTFPLEGTSQAPGIVVIDGGDPSGTVIINGQPEEINVGITQISIDLDKDFTIENTGSSDLNILSISVDNPVFSVLNVPGVIPPGGDTSFTIRLNSMEPGIYSSIVTVTSDIGDYNFPIIGEVVDNPPIIIYNAVTPNGDGRHDFLNLENIEFYQGNQVFIYTKLGSLVYKIDDYSNIDSSLRFEGYSNQGGSDMLPNGTYYYIIIRGESFESLSGFFILEF